SDIEPAIAEPAVDRVIAANRLGELPQSIECGAAVLLTASGRRRLPGSRGSGLDQALDQRRGLDERQIADPHDQVHPGAGAALVAVERAGAVLIVPPEPILSPACGTGSVLVAQVVRMDTERGQNAVPAAAGTLAQAGLGEGGHDAFLDFANAIWRDLTQLRVVRLGSIGGRWSKPLGQ